MKYKIWTPDGWKEFDGVKHLGKKETIKITLDNGLVITCTKDHKIYVNLFECVEANKLCVNDLVFTNDGLVSIKNIEENGIQDVYDILEVQDGNKFYANDILVHNCEFIGKSNSLIDSQILRQKMLEIDSRKITYKYVIDNDVRFYQDLNPWQKYLVAIDTSMGVSGDFAAIQVFSFPGFIQVAEWQSDNLNQNGQIEKLKTIIEYIYKEIKKLGNRNPEVYWSLENNGSAEGFICALRELDSKTDKSYIRYGKLITENGNKRIGFTTTNRTKPMACSQLKILFESNRFHIFSREYLVQLSNFAAKSAISHSANGDGHDDLISASLIIIMMYLQCKNMFDLDMEIMPSIINEPIVIDDDMPFLFNTKIF